MVSNCAMSFDPAERDAAVVAVDVSGLVQATSDDAVGVVTAALGGDGVASSAE